ncbi:MAG: two-component regulator propeller domain-containing protein [Rhodothermales bacterium]
MSQSAVTCIEQDQDGFLWFGTQRGLNRFDGREFVSFYASDSSGLHDDYIRDLVSGRKRDLWIGTRNGLSRYSRITGNIESYFLGQSNNKPISVNKISIGEGSNIWLGTSNGLYRFDSDDGEITQYDNLFATNDTLSHASIFSLELVDKTLWVGSRGGLDLVNLENGSIEHPFDYLKGTNVYALLKDKTGNMWIGTDRKGLYYVNKDSILNSNRILPISVHDDFLPLTVSVIKEDDDSIYWIGTAGDGLYRYDLNNNIISKYENEINIDESLSNNGVYSIKKDKRGQVWIGTWNGFDQLFNENEVFSSYKYREGTRRGITHNLIMPMVESSPDKLWISTNGGGLNLLDRKSKLFYHPEQLYPAAKDKYEEVWTLHYGVNDILWIGTWGQGLIEYDVSTNSIIKEHLFNPDVATGIYAPSNRIYSIYGTKEYLWIGSLLGGLNRYSIREKTFRSYRNIPDDSTSLSNDEVNPIFESEDGQLWVGTYGGGLNKFNSNTETFDRYLHDPDDLNSISSNMITAINEFPEGILWVGTLSDGLNRLDLSTGEFTRFNESHGLPNNAVTGILVDEQGYLWISTNKGLSRFNPTALEFKNFDTRDGLQSNIIHIGSHYKSDSGEMFFGGDNGLNSFFPKYINQQDTIPPSIVFTKLIVDETEITPGEGQPIDKSISHADQISLKAHQNNFSIDFAALHFKRPWRHKYEYRLKGEHDTWRVPDENRRASYQNLDDGHYTFEVKAANSDGYWTPEPTTISIEIAPFWYETWWAWLIWLTSGGLCIFGLVRWRTRAVEERAKQLEVTVKERTAEIEEQNNQLEEQAHQLLEMDRVKSTFFANISHEFRTPLTTILGPIQDTLNGAHGPVKDQVRNLLLIVQRSGMTLKDLIDQLLALAKLEAGEMLLHPRKTDLVQYARHRMPGFDVNAKRKDITLSLEPDSEPLELYLDADKLKYIFNNLLSNAIKFTEKGGMINLHLSSVMDEDSKGWVQLCVEDSGTGISDEKLPYIFDRFHQGDASSTRLHEGTGIGLALTKQLVEMHGGTIGVESEIGVGSKFIVWFPVGTSHLPANSILDEEWAPDPLDNEIEEDNDDAFFDTNAKAGKDAPKVLLVEDREDVRAYVKTLLEQRYQIFEAENGKLGFDKAMELLPDLIISDVMMPEWDGFEMVKMIKQEPALKETRIMMLTARAAEEDLHAGLKEGVDAFVVKPFNSTELQIRAENLIEVRKAIAANRIEIGASTKEVDSQDAEFIKKVRACVESRIKEVKATDIAAEVFLGPRQLNRRLQSILGMSARAYIQMIRLETAAQLLEANHDQVAQIAFQVGYTDANHFSRVFKQAFGVTPSDYMNGKRREDSST